MSQNHVPEPSPGASDEPDAQEDDTTLGGYFDTHNRPPAFEGRDGQPYTVSVEVEKTPNLVRPFAGFLVFPRWAETGLGIVGHVETPILWEGTSRQAVEEAAHATELLRVKELLDEAIGARPADAES